MPFQAVIARVHLRHPTTVAAAARRAAPCEAVATARFLTTNARRVSGVPGGPVAVVPSVQPVVHPGLVGVRPAAARCAAASAGRPPARPAIPGPAPASTPRGAPAAGRSSAVRGRAGRYGRWQVLPTLHPQAQGVHGEPAVIPGGKPPRAWCAIELGVRVCLRPLLRILTHIPRPQPSTGSVASAGEAAGPAARSPVGQAAGQPTRSADAPAADRSRRTPTLGVPGRTGEPPSPRPAGVNLTLATARRWAVGQDAPPFPSPASEFPNPGVHRRSRCETHATADTGGAAPEHLCRDHRNKGRGT
jgi:hypothetical protein